MLPELSLVRLFPLLFSSAILKVPQSDILEYPEQVYTQNSKVATVTFVLPSLQDAAGFSPPESVLSSTTTVFEGSSDDHKKLLPVIGIPRLLRRPSFVKTFSVCNFRFVLTLFTLEHLSAPCSNGSTETA